MSKKCPECGADTVIEQIPNPFGGFDRERRCTGLIDLGPNKLLEPCGWSEMAEDSLTLFELPKISRQPGSKFTHKEVVNIAYKWVLKNGSCGIAFKELDCAGSNEIPDVIAFSSWHSVMIEVKVTRSDFLCDKNKSFRKNPAEGMGGMRYYCCPTGLIKKEELPTGWGLIYVNEKGKATKVHSSAPGETGSRYAQFEKNHMAERGIMYSALRRLFIKGYVKYIYDKEYNRSTTPDQLILLNNNEDGK